MTRTAGSAACRRAAAIGLVGSAAVTLGVAPAAAAHGHRVTVGDRAEAWYATQSITNCLALVGCPLTDALPPVVGADALHVGVAAGKESSRSYLVPAINGTRRAIPAAGTMRIPIDTAPLAGTVDATAASVRACLVVGRVDDGVAGSTGKPPAVDCSVTAPATYSTTPSPHLSVGLARFLVAWRTGSPVRGIALLPDLRAAAAATTWQLALDARDQAGVAHVSWLLIRSSPKVREGGGTPSPAPSATQPAASSGASQAVLPPATVTTQPGSSVAPVPVVAPLVATSLVAAGPTHFRGRAVFLLPLVFLAAAVFLVRLFTTDPPRREGASWPIVRAKQLPSSRRS